MTQQTQDFLTDGDVTLADLENGSNPILDRVKKRLLNEASTGDAHMAHPSHSSSTGGGHNSYVSGRFEDAPTVEKK